MVLKVSFFLALCIILHISQNKENRTLLISFNFGFPKAVIVKVLGGVFWFGCWFGCGFLLSLLFCLYSLLGLFMKTEVF